MHQKCNAEMLNYQKNYLTQHNEFIPKTHFLELTYRTDKHQPDLSKKSKQSEKVHKTNSKLTETLSIFLKK